MHFTKWHGCGNDYVFVNGFEENFDDVYSKIVAISDRHFGVGSDGVIFLLPSDKADIRMRMFNNDASEGEMCGNGIRCLSRWAYELGLVKAKRFSVETGAGILYPEILEDGNVRVDMGRPHLLADEIPVTGYGKGPVIAQPLTNEANGKTYTVTCVSMGNPHCVIFVDDIKDVDLTGEGSGGGCPFSEKNEYGICRAAWRAPFPYACVGKRYRDHHGLRHRHLCDCRRSDPEWPYQRLC